MTPSLEAAIDAAAIIAAAGRADVAEIVTSADLILASDRGREVIGLLALLVSTRLGENGTANFIEVVATIVAEQEGFTE